MKEPLTTEEVIRRAARVAEFMKDEAIVEAIANMKWKCYDDFLKAGPTDELRLAQARGKNLENFADELQVVQDRGVFEAEKVIQQEKARTVL